MFRKVWTQIVANFFTHWQAHMGKMGKWPWQCTTTGLDNSTEFRMAKIRKAVTEIWLPQVWQPPDRPARRAEGQKEFIICACHAVVLSPNLKENHPSYIWFWTYRHGCKQNINSYVIWNHENKYILCNVIFLSIEWYHKTPLKTRMMIS